ncbi:MAG TPA: hypothetical protein VEA99_10875, partial [Gemmatimonadaceae bacterium]|nr:hypothetical protein [Gemmatimonadaceae bacterium]
MLASASELPAAPVTGAVALEINVQLLDLGDGAYCLNHALRQRQLYGGEIVRGAFEAASAGRAPESSALRDALVEHGFVVRPGEAPEREHRRLLEAEDTR